MLRSRPLMTAESEMPAAGFNRGSCFISAQSMRPLDVINTMSIPVEVLMPITGHPGFC